MMDVPVIVDSRETEKRKKRAEKIWGEKSIRIMKLPVGDYVYKDVGLEFKTVEDFIGSVKSKRIYNQAISLSETFNHHYVIIYGDVGYTLNRLHRYGHTFTVPQYLGALASLSQITNVLSVENESQAFKLAKSLFEKCTDGKNRMVKTPVREKRGSRKKNKMVTILSLIGDINTKRAEKLVDELEIRTFKDKIEMSEEDIMGVKGFGKKTASNIVKYLR